ncbi:MAG: hypothetical protein ACLFVB_09665 [Thermoplasmata archaeon]
MDDEDIQILIKGELDNSLNKLIGSNKVAYCALVNNRNQIIHEKADEYEGGLSARTYYSVYDSLGFESDKKIDYISLNTEDYVHIITKVSDEYFLVSKVYEKNDEESIAQYMDILVKFLKNNWLTKHDKIFKLKKKYKRSKM